MHAVQGLPARRRRRTEDNSRRFASETFTNEDFLAFLRAYLVGDVVPLTGIAHFLLELKEGK
jgi:hypothetical protein